MAGINHVTGEWRWIPGTRGLKRGCPMKDGKIVNKNKNIYLSLLSRSFSHHHLRCGGWLNFRKLL